MQHPVLDGCDEGLGSHDHPADHLLYQVLLVLKTTSGLHPKNFSTLALRVVLQLIGNLNECVALKLYADNAEEALSAFCRC